MVKMHILTVIYMEILYIQYKYMRGMQFFKTGINILVGAI